MLDVFGMLMNRLKQQNPNMANAPWASSGLSAIVNRDANSGEQIANNLINSMGGNKDEVLRQAQEWAKSVGLM